MSGLVPLHPEAVPGDPATLRWIVPAGIVGGAGRVVACPPALAGLVADGTIGAVEAEPGAVRVTLGATSSWAADGARVRVALQEALGEARDGLGSFDTAGGTGEAALRAAVEDVLAGEVGAYLASHGGAATILEVTDRDVVLDLGGACAGCPARGFTLHARIESAIRERYPDLAEVRLAERHRGPVVTLGRWRDSLVRR